MKQFMNSFCGAMLVIAFASFADIDNDTPQVVASVQELPSTQDNVQLNYDTQPNNQQPFQTVSTEETKPETETAKPIQQTEYEQAKSEAIEKVNEAEAAVAKLEKVKAANNSQPEFEEVTEYRMVRVPRYCGGRECGYTMRSMPVKRLVQKQPNSSWSNTQTVGYASSGTYGGAQTVGYASSGTYGSAQTVGYGSAGAYGYSNVGYDNVGYGSAGAHSYGSYNARGNPTYASVRNGFRPMRNFFAWRAAVRHERSGRFLSARGY